MPVDTKHREYKARASQWKRVRDCNDGVDAVKAAGTEYLPPLDTHRGTTSAGDVRYAAYLKRAMFFNATGRTVEGFSGALFQREPEVEAPAEVEAHLEDITLTGVSLELFGHRATQEVLVTGRYGVLVEVGSDEVPAPEIRPYWCGYRAEDVVNWRTARVGGDPEVLTRVVLRETYDEVDPKDPFNIVEKVQYRVLDLVDGVYTQQRWRLKEDQVGRTEWISVDEEPVVPTRMGKSLSFIPFLFLGTGSASARTTKPPLLDLAEVNLSHYRTMADLEHGRHFTALPTPWFSGLVDDGAGPIVLGSGQALQLQENGSAGMLEFSGSGLAALVTAEQDKRRIMAQLGTKLLEDHTGSAETATAVAMRSSTEHATLRTIAHAVEFGLETALRWHAWWVGTEADLDDVDVSVSLNKDFFAVRMSAAEIPSWVSALQAGAVSHDTFYAALVRGGIARPGVTAEQERAAIESAKPQAVADANAEDEPVMDAGDYRVTKRGGKYLVLAADGKRVGSHDTPEAARAQLDALSTSGARVEGAGAV